MTKLNGRKTACAVLILCAAVVSGAQTLTTLAIFDGTNGENPFGSLVQGLDGNLYGTTSSGGTGAYCVPGYNGCGTVFQITPSAQLTTLYNFCSQPSCTDGAFPAAGMLLGTDGKLYGTTEGGGNNPSCSGELGCGTVFEIASTGRLTTLYSFCSQANCADGAKPLSGLMQAANGKFYGTTSTGGTNNSGTAFAVTTAGTLITLHNFCSRGYPHCIDGGMPYGGLIQATDGNLYGTTDQGGNGSRGTIFRLTLGGKLATVHAFCLGNCTDGASPRGTLVQAANGSLYGTTSIGGVYCTGGCGTVFEITLTGNFTKLYDFCSLPNCADGAFPQAGLVQGTDGNLFGTTSGTLYEITPAGQFTNLYNFCSQPNCADGSYPWANLLQHTDGDFYGTTVYGGDSTCNGTAGCGTVFGLSEGLGPFVKTVPAAARVGVRVGILGDGLTAATSVTFNGTPAQFTVKLPTLILTHVPKGATTGTVRVTLPSGTLTSNVPFHVIP